MHANSHESRKLRALAHAHRRDISFDRGKTAGDEIHPDDLEHPPTRGLQRGGAVERDRFGQRSY
jgi:hypothetical protein